MELYPKNAGAELDRELFRMPGAEYRGAPFWSWNCRLEERRLIEQIDVLKAMGLGGFHIHSRTGLETPYMGAEWLRLVQACVEHARREGMLAWLYDEDCWPSGFGGGLVTREQRYRAKYLLFTSRPYGAAPSASAGESAVIGPRPTARAENGTLLARYAVTLRGGRLAAARRLAEGEAAPAGATIWYAYLETEQESSRYNHQTYVDTLSRAATERFIAVTHVPYAEAVGADFGGVVPAIFTDEPQLTRKQGLSRADEARDLILPWTDDLFASYQAAYGQALEEHLPELFWELPEGQASVARYRFHDHVTARFAQAFAGTLAEWCAAHGLALTGHMMEEPTLESQTAAIGEAMRSLAAFQLPGIDILCDRREYTTAKQAQSVARQYGRPGVLSELYGVTNWDFDFVGHKAQGDWQAALGVTVRVHHLTWVSMGGEAKRDYPASIGDHAPWWREYRLVEDHFARLNTALTRGHGLARVAVIHPIESYWLCYGPLEHTAAERETRERAFANLTDWLLHGLIDFDFVAESLLPELSPIDDLVPASTPNAPASTPNAPASTPNVPASTPNALASTPNALASNLRMPALTVGAMGYAAVIVPGLRTVRATTLERLERFCDAGGTVIFAGEVPALVEAEPSERARQLAERCTRVELAREPMLGAVEQLREVGVQLADGRAADTILHQIRQDGDRRYIFFCNLDRLRPREGARITLRGEWQVTLLDTLTGDSAPLAASYHDGATHLEWDFTPHGHLLLALEPGRREAGLRPARQTLVEVGRLAGPVPVTLSEPNVLLLDQAEWQLGDAAWQPADELLRIDNLVRAQLGYPIRINRIAQPWSEPDDPTIRRSDDPTIQPTGQPMSRQGDGAEPDDGALAHTLRLRFSVQIDVPVDAPMLALEQAQQVQISLDGTLVLSTITGWYVDEAIQTVRLPRLEAGTHELVLTLDYRRKTSLEWCYLLGDFGVVVAGSQARIVAPVRELAFGDWTNQGLPFYGGNVTYHCQIAGTGVALRPGDRRQAQEAGQAQQQATPVPPHLTLRAAKFKAPLLRVELDGQRLGPIAFAPFQIELGALAEGTHTLDITAYGSRINTFGCVHNADEHAFWFGPNAWRTTGDDWAYDYRLKPAGLLVAPRLLAADVPPQ